MPGGTAAAGTLPLPTRCRAGSCLILLSCFDLDNEFGGGSCKDLAEMVAGNGTPLGAITTAVGGA